MPNPSLYLNGLATHYTPSRTYFDVARRHRAGIQSKLEADMDILGMFETGSLGHGTGVARYSDADFLVKLDGERVDPQLALDRVRASLGAKYWATTVRVSRPAVVCQFNSRAETVEITPAYPDYLYDGYWIPDPVNKSSWMKTYPKEHNAYVNNVNRNSGDVKKFARLAKIWKYERKVPVSSFYLEMRAAEFVYGTGQMLVSTAVSAFFDHLWATKLTPMSDPTGLGDSFTSCSSVSSTKETLSKLSYAAAWAHEAYRAERNGDPNEAIRNWQLVFNQ